MRAERPGPNYGVRTPGMSRHYDLCGRKNHRPNLQCPNNLEGIDMVLIARAFAGSCTWDLQVRTRPILQLD